MVPAWLPPLLRCLGCGGNHLEWSADHALLLCRSCCASLPIHEGVVRIQSGTEDEAVGRERQAVLDIERTTSDVDSFTLEELLADGGELREALLSLPYGNESWRFRREGYFTNVRKFAPEFDYVVRQLNLPVGASVLDVGADLTWSTARLAACGWRAVATDINHHLPAAAHFRRGGIAYATVNVDMHAPAFADGAFDAVTAFNALHHTHRLSDLTENLARVLRPGGKLAFVEPFCRSEQERQDFGRAQIDLGINENVHLLEEWHDAFARVGLQRQTCLLTTAFSGVYEKPLAGPRPPFSSLDAARDDFFSGFYDASMQAPASLPKPSPPGEILHVPVVVENRSDVAWSSLGSLPVFLSYHLHRLSGGDSELVVFDNPRAALPGFVEPGRRVEVSLPIEVPQQPGDYVAVIDLVEESRTWFADQGTPTAAFRFQVR